MRRLVPTGPPEEIRYLKVKVNRENLAKLPVMYANHVEVRANPEETYILLCLRQDLNLAFDDNFAESVAEPFATILLSTTHAQRLGKALLNQTNLYLDTPGESTNDENTQS